jgi:hypothetical protein
VDADIGFGASRVGRNRKAWGVSPSVHASRSAVARVSRPSAAYRRVAAHGANRERNQELPWVIPPPLPLEVLSLIVELVIVAVPSLSNPRRNTENCSGVWDPGVPTTTGLREAGNASPIAARTEEPECYPKTGALEACPLRHGSRRGRCQFARKPVCFGSHRR